MNLDTADPLEKQLARLAARARGRRTPALSYAVATTSGHTYASAVGPADLDERREVTVEDQMPWFSMTKIATATTMVRLAARGVVDLDAHVAAYVPEYHTGIHQPTVRQLLTHTAGLGNPLPIRWIRPVGQPADADLVASIVRKHGAPKRRPGEHAAYSNIGYLLAGQVIEAVTGEPVEQVVSDVVLRPIGMERTGFRYDPSSPHAIGYVRAPRAVRPLLRRLLPNGVVGQHVAGFTALRPFLVEGAAYGGLVGAPSDAARLALAHLQPDGPLGDLSAMREITCPGKPFDHGTGWFRKPADIDRTPPFVEHYGTGGGFWNAMRIYPTLGVAVVGMTNGTSAWSFDEFFTSVVELMQHEGRT